MKRSIAYFLASPKLTLSNPTSIDNQKKQIKIKRNIAPKNPMSLILFLLDLMASNKSGSSLFFPLRYKRTHKESKEIIKKSKTTYARERGNVGSRKLVEAT